MVPSPATSLMIGQPQASQSLAAWELAHAFLPPALRPPPGSALSAFGEESGADGLFGAWRQGRLVGAVWGEVQPGKAAVAHPPQLIAGESPGTALALLEALEAFFRREGARFYQVQLEENASPGQTRVLAAAGLRHAADLLFLASKRNDFPHVAPQELQFEPYLECDRRRLAEIVERSYHGTLDLPALDGARALDDVLDGYRQTGEVHPGCWRLVIHQGADVGCLLLTEHPPHQQWEVVYMGIAPEFRGRGWGTAVARYAQFLVGQEGGEGLLLAVDARNAPALKSYARAGFRPWRQRRVFLKRLAEG